MPWLRLVLMTVLVCLRPGWGLAGDEETALREAGLVDVQTTAAGVRLDMRYATTNNFAGKAVYPSPRCFLMALVAEALARVQQSLEKQGLGLVVMDCYRPFSVQETFWSLVPDDRYVAKPVRDEAGRPASGSKHNRGAAVDASLVRLDGGAMEMPTAFDDFTELAHSDNRDVSPAAQVHRGILHEAMTAQGFKILPTEWWHFDGPGWERLPLLDLPLPAGN